MSSTLVQLAHLISQSVQTIEKTCAKNGTKVPDLDALFDPQSEKFRLDTAIGEAVSTATAAALQLAAILEPPTLSAGRCALSGYKAVALETALTINTVEILREAGDQGLHVDQIASKSQTSIDPKKLARLLRYLSTHHVFREISPDVFTNNRISSVLDTGKSIQVLLERPQEKHDDTPGFTAVIEHALDIMFKSAPHVAGVLVDPKTALSGEPNETAFNKAFNTDLTTWAWLEQPGQEYRLRVTGLGMNGVKVMQPANAILSGFDWRGLTKKDTIVDVGGGIGAVGLEIAKANPHVNIVIQDRDAVMEQAKELWAKEMPEAIESGRVKLEGHDFFAPQPRRNTSVYLLKQILHDWSDTYAYKILKLLRDNANADTRLVIVDSIVSYACHDSSLEGPDAIPGAASREAPSPLLANYGAVNDMQYIGDITMLLAFNAQDRTFGQYQALLKEAGWRIVKVYRGEGMSAFQKHIEAVVI